MIDLSPCRIVVVDDEDYDRERIVASLGDVIRARRENQAGRFVLESSGNAHEVASRIRQSGEPPWDIVLSDVLMPHPKTGREPEKNGAFHIAQVIRERYAGRTPPLRIAAVSSKPGYLKASRLLAEFENEVEWFWYVVKSADVTRGDGTETLQEAIPWKWALMTLIDQHRSAHWGMTLLRQGEQLEEWTTLVFRSAKSQRVVHEIPHIARNPRSRTVLLLGETSVGKEIFARLLHEHRRHALGAKGRFISFNCGASYSKGLLTGQLFGHYRDSFTGAGRDQRGLFEQASGGGTVFLDEIDGLSVDDQRSLLRVLRTGEIQKIGEPPASGYPRFEGSLVVLATSATDLESLLLPDLRARIASNTLRIPPLRERRDDLVGAANAMLEERAAGHDARFDDGALRWLVDPAWTWPHNYATLESLLNVAFAHGAIGPVVTAADLERASREIEWGTRPEGADARSYSTPAHGRAARMTRERYEALLEKDPTATTVAAWAKRHGFLPNTVRHWIRHRGWPSPRLQSTSGDD